MSIIVFGIIFLLLVYVVLKKELNTGPAHKSCYRGYHLDSDKLETILDRIEWSLLRPTRINFMSRYLMWGLWVTFLGTILIMESIPSIGMFLRNWIMISIILLSLHGYYYWHSDKFSFFNNLKGIKKLRRSLSVQKGDFDLLNIHKNKIFLGCEASWTFTHQDYKLGTEFP